MIEDCLWSGAGEAEGKKESAQIAPGASKEFEGVQDCDSCGRERLHTESTLRFLSFCFSQLRNGAIGRAHRCHMNLEAQAA